MVVPIRELAAAGVVAMVAVMPQPRVVIPHMPQATLVRLVVIQVVMALLTQAL